MDIETELNIVKQSQLFPNPKTQSQETNIQKKEVECKTIVSESGLYNLDYSINPYTGCQHDCIYCYVPAMRKRWGEKREWGKYVDIKVNSPVVLQKQLKKLKSGSILVSSVTDPYQPLEKEYCLTRKILSSLSKKNFQVFVLTKSKLVLRDIDVFLQNPDWQIGMTITTNDDSIRKLLEPNASPIEDRLNALSTLCKAGLTTYVFLGPIIPFLTGGSIIDLLDYLESINVSYIMVDRINQRGGNINRLVPFLKRNKPEKEVEFIQACKVNSPYFSDLKDRLIGECESRKLPVNFNY